MSEHGDEAAYWQRHYGVGAGPLHRRGFRVFGLAVVGALGLIVLFVLLGALVTALF